MGSLIQVNKWCQLIKLRTSNFSLSLSLSLSLSFSLPSHLSSIGKTYTVTGTPSDPGILPRSLDVIFNSIDQQQLSSVSVKPKHFSELIHLSKEEASEMKTYRENILNMVSILCRFCACSNLHKLSVMNIMMSPNDLGVGWSPLLSRLVRWWILVIYSTSRLCPRVLQWTMRQSWLENTTSALYQPSLKPPPHSPTSMVRHTNNNGIEVEKLISWLCGTLMIDI